MPRAAIDDLRRRIERSAAPRCGREALPFGLDGIDRVLPGGGLAVGAHQAAPARILPPHRGTTVLGYKHRPGISAPVMCTENLNSGVVVVKFAKDGV